jgi:hypothetical protein
MAIEPGAVATELPTHISRGAATVAMARSPSAARPCDREDPDGYPSWLSSTTAIRVPITPVAAAARGPAMSFATAAQAVTITAAARRTTIGALTWDGGSRLTMMPTATIATMRT